MSPIRRAAASALRKRSAHEMRTYVQALIVDPLLFCQDAWNMAIRSEISKIFARSGPPPFRPYLAHSAGS